jgi:hypothetical protein
MMSKEDREAKAVLWLQRLQEAEAAKEPLGAYARRHGLKRRHRQRRSRQCPHVQPGSDSAGQRP